jgi:excisionase family DNA binding protein
MTHVDDNAPKAMDAGTYDVPDVAALLKCSERHVRNMAAANQLPGVIRCGRLLRFHRGMLNDWLTAQAKEGRCG